MARNLLRADLEIMVFARDKESIKPVLDAGAHWVDSPALLASSSDYIFTMLGNPSDVEEVYLGGNGLLKNSRPNTVLCDMTTSSPELAKKIYDACSVKIQILDAPVTGGVAGAKSGQLTFMVGGAESTLRQVTPFLETMGSKIIHMGNAGAGQTAKSCNQIAVAGILLGAVEALNHAQKNALNIDRMLEILNSGTAASPLLKSLNQRLKEVGHAPSFSISHFVKDLKIAAADAARAGYTISTVDFCLHYVEALEQSNNGEKGLQILLDPDKNQRNRLPNSLLSGR